jgi:hypothetical protein
MATPIENGEPEPVSVDWLDRYRGGKGEEQREHVPLIPAATKLARIA